PFKGPVVDRPFFLFPDSHLRISPVGTQASSPLAAQIRTLCPSVLKVGSRLPAGEFEIADRLPIGPRKIEAARPPGHSSESSARRFAREPGQLPTGRLDNADR